MKRFLIVLIVLIHTTAYGEEFPTDDIGSHIKVLASDNLAGRLAGSPGGFNAGDYIAGEFKKTGLLPAVNGSYFQSFDIVTKKSGKNNSLLISKEQFKIFEDYVPLTVCAAGRIPLTPPLIKGEGGGFEGSSDEVIGKISFADAEADMRGKVAVVRYDASAGEGWLTSKIKAAEEGGAVALLILKKDLYSDYSVWEELIPLALRTRWEKTLKEDFSHFLEMKVAQKRNLAPPVTSNIPCLLVREDSFRGESQNPPLPVAMLRSNGNPALLEEGGTSISIKVDIEEDKIPARNVIGYRPGKGKKKDEEIIIGAHYDHLGLDSKGRPFPGADDNASGVAAMLEVARGLSGKALARTVVFIAFDGEEWGLTGSRYYTDHPPYPLDKTVLMINMDSIGRNEPDAIHFLGSQRSPDVRKVAGKMADERGIKLLDDIEFAFKYGSDHYPFFEKGIPAIDLTSSYHEDFHKTTDTPEKVNVDKVSKIAALVYHLTLEATDSEIYFQKPLQVDVPFPIQR